MSIRTGDTDQAVVSLTNLTMDPVFFTNGLASPATWIERGPINGTISPGASQNVTLNFETLGISPGVYTNTLEVDYDNLGTLEIPLIVDIYVPPLVISVDSLVAEMLPNDTESTFFTLKNNTGAPMDFSIDMEIQELWMSYDPEEGVLVPDGSMSVNFEFNSLALIEGVYENNLVISYNGSEEEKIPVKLDVVYLGIGEKDFIRDLVILPNPVSDRAVLNFSLNESMQLKAGLYDLSGAMVYGIADGRYPEGEVNINLDPPAGLSNGIYLLTIEGEGFSVSRKLVITDN
jgi:hypothetical protein